MININIKKISDNQADGMLICKEKTTGEIIKIDSGYSLNHDCAFTIPK